MQMPVEEKRVTNVPSRTGLDSMVHLHLRMETYHAENEVKMKNGGILTNHRIRDSLCLK